MATKMLLRVVSVGVACLAILLAYVAYTPLPPDMEDRPRAMLILGILKLLLVTPFEVSNWLGYGSYLDNLETIQNAMATDYSKPVPSAALGILDVTRDRIADVPVNVYRPKDVKDGELLPALIYLHHGGWVIGTADVVDSAAHIWANCSRKITIAVDYSHAPNHPFPVPVQECLAVTKHVLSQGKSMGIDVNRVGILGDANGGNMAAAIANHLTQEKSAAGLPPLKYQVLMWPPMQAINMRIPSYLEIGNVILHPSLHFQGGFWAAYLGLDRTKLDEIVNVMKQNGHVSSELLRNSKYSKYIDLKNLPEKFRKPRPEIMGHAVEPDPQVETDEKIFEQIKDKLVDPMFSPLMAPDLRGVPPAMVFVSEFEINRDNGLLYAHRLKEAGVRTEVVIGDGFHIDYNPVFPAPLRSKSGEKTAEAVCGFIQREA